MNVVSKYRQQDGHSDKFDQLPNGMVGYMRVSLFGIHCFALNNPGILTRILYFNIHQSSRVPKTDRPHVGV